METLLTVCYGKIFMIFIHYLLCCLVPQQPIISEQQQCKGNTKIRQIKLKLHCQSHTLDETFLSQGVLAGCSFSVTLTISRQIK